MNIQCIRSGMTNCWLVRWSGRTILIDAGSAAERSFPVRLARIIDPRMIELLVLTHGHADHVGHAALLREQFGIPVAISAADLPLVRASSICVPPACTALGMLTRRSLTHQMDRSHYPAFTPDFFLPDGLPPSVSLIPCPGHTPGSCALLIGENLFAGDAAMNITFPGMPWFAENAAAAWHSLLRLSDAACRMVYPGHGRPFRIEKLRHIKHKQRNAL